MPTKAHVKRVEVMLALMMKGESDLRPRFALTACRFVRWKLS
jgi:hypothetical protein